MKESKGLDEFLVKVEMLQKFDTLFDNINQTFGIWGEYSDDCYRLKEDYIDYVADDFNMDRELLHWFVLDCEYGRFPKRLTILPFWSTTEVELLIDSGTVFYNAMLQLTGSDLGIRV